METCRHARRTLGADQALLKRLGDHYADQAEALMIRAGQKGGY